MTELLKGRRMKCHKCNQDSIKAGQVITKKKGDMPQFIVRCEICGLTIGSGFGENMEKLCELFLYNEGLDAAYKLGREAYLESKVSGDNPYGTGPDQIGMHSSWDDGWQFEELIYENAGYSFFAEKLKKKLEEAVKENEELEKEKKDYYIKYDNLKHMVKVLSDQKYILGRTYRQDLVFIRDEHKIPDK